MQILSQIKAVLKIDAIKSNRAPAAPPVTSSNANRNNKEVIATTFSNSFPGFQQKSQQQNNNLPVHIWLFLTVAEL